MDAWCAPHSRSAELTSNTSKTRHQKRSAETGGRNGASIAKFRTRRPAHICDSSRYRAVFERPSYVTRWRRTGWLGRRDSNLCISKSDLRYGAVLERHSYVTRWMGGGIRTSASGICLPAGFTAVVPASCTRLLEVQRTICCHSLRRTIALCPIAHDS